MTRLVGPKRSRPVLRYRKVTVPQHATYELSKQSQCCCSSAGSRPRVVFALFVAKIRFVPSSKEIEARKGGGAGRKEGRKAGNKTNSNSRALRTCFVVYHVMLVSRILRLCHGPFWQLSSKGAPNAVPCMPYCKARVCPLHVTEEVIPTWALHIGLADAVVQASRLDT